MHYELDAFRDGNLLTRAGQLQAISQILREWVDSPEPLPNEIYVEAAFPQEHYLADMERNLDKLNKVIEPRGLMDKLAHQAFRSMSGIEGKLRPIRYKRDPAEADEKLLMIVDVSGLSKADLAKFSDFLSRNAHRV